MDQSRSSRKKQMKDSRQQDNKQNEPTAKQAKKEDSDKSSGITSTRRSTYDENDPSSSVQSSLLDPLAGPLIPTVASQIGPVGAVATGLRPVSADNKDTKLDTGDLKLTNTEDNGTISTNTERTGTAGTSLIGVQSTPQPTTSSQMDASVAPPTVSDERQTDEPTPRSNPHPEVPPLTLRLQVRPRNPLTDPPNLEEFIQANNDPSLGPHPRANQYEPGLPRALVAYYEDPFWTSLRRVPIPADMPIPPRPFDYEQRERELNLLRQQQLDPNYVPPAVAVLSFTLGFMTEVLQQPQQIQAQVNPNDQQGSSGDYQDNSEDHPGPSSS